VIQGLQFIPRGVAYEMGKAAAGEILRGERRRAVLDLRSYGRHPKHFARTAGSVIAGFLRGLERAPARNLTCGVIPVVPATLRAELWAQISRLPGEFPGIAMAM
jgi:hypothetical protein